MEWKFYGALWGTLSFHLPLGYSLLHWPKTYSCLTHQEVPSSKFPVPNLDKKCIRLSDLAHFHETTKIYFVAKPWKKSLNIGGRGVKIFHSFFGRKSYFLLISDTSIILWIRLWLHPPNFYPHQGSFPLSKQQFSRYNSIEASFFVVVIAPIPFLSYLHTLCTHRSC